MRRCAALANTVKARQLRESELVQAYQSLLEQETQQLKSECCTGSPRAAVARRAAASTPREGWDRFRSNKIWVQNDTNHDLVIYVDTFRTTAELVASIRQSRSSVTAADIAKELNKLAEDALVQIEESPDHTKQLLELAAGTGGAYVTVAVQHNRALLFCKDMRVLPGYCLYISGEPFIDPLLDPHAVTDMHHALSTPDLQPETGRQLVQVS